MWEKTEKVSARGWGTGKMIEPVCGFCKEGAWIVNARHSGRVCPDCGVLYVWNGKETFYNQLKGGEWYLDRVMVRGTGKAGATLWRQVPYGCLVVVDKWSKEV